MFKRLSGFISGYYRLRVPKEISTAVFALLFRLGMSFFGERTDRNGCISLCLPWKYGVLFRETAEEEGLLQNAEMSDIRGMPRVLFFLGNRPGMAVGVLLFLVWTFVSGRIIWDIRIEGNTKTEDSEIIALLGEHGVTYGTWYPSVDFDAVHAACLADSDSVGWLSVYMHGTVAEVQVRELVRQERTEKKEGVYANVIASEDGVIDIVKVFEGQGTAKPGDVVRKGDVVISGVMERKDMNLPDGGVRYEYASGEVMAKVFRLIEVKIGLTRDEKVPTGQETVRKSIKIFGNVVNLFKNTGIGYSKYDKIDKINRLSFFGICDLPVWVSETVYREYGYESREIPAEQAAAEGLAELRRLTDEAAEDGETLERSVDAYFEDGAYIIKCLMYCLRDIGQTAEFTVRSESVSDG